MKKIISIITLLSVLTFAENPKPYAALGDVIYNNLEGIEKLEEIPMYKVYVKKIEQYTAKVRELKRKGFDLEKKPTPQLKKEYLSGLRSVSRENDFYVRWANKAFLASMKNEDSTTFEKIINTGLINTDAHKEDILDYYFAHQEDVNASGVIENYLAEDAKLRALREAQRKKYKTKKELEAEKIRRIREEDRRKQEELERRLSEEVAKKKEQIRDNQKSELFK